MKKTVLSIFILIFAVAAGYYFGFRERPVEFVVHEQVIGGELATTSTNIRLNAEELRQGGAVEPIISPELQKQLLSLPWYVTRASAITAYLLMFMAIIWGAGMTTGLIYRLANPVKAWLIHKYISVGLGAMVLVHMISLLFDEYLEFSVRHLLIPFASGFKPLYLTLGIASFYVLLIIVLSSLLFRLRWPRLWRAIHYLTYPLFVATLFHGLYIGTDSQSQAMQSVYWSTGIIFTGLLAVRFIYTPIKNRS